METTTDKRFDSNSLYGQQIENTKYLLNVVIIYLTKAPKAYSIKNSLYALICLINKQKKSLTFFCILELSSNFYPHSHKKTRLRTSIFEINLFIIVA